MSRIDRTSAHLALTVQQDDGLLEREGVPDLDLAVGTIEHVERKKDDEGCRPLDALEHALLREVGRPIVVPHFEAHALELEVDG